MNGIITGSRLDRLRRLQTRIGMEIQVLEDGERLLALRRVLTETKTKRQRLAAERAKERRDQRRAATMAHLDEAAAIGEAAPADLVRAWAREQGIEVGPRGRIALDLRKQYLAAQAAS